ncbi:MAG: 3-deoxy-D-manno-octulosonic acid transferase [Thiohalomonadales bacterium]
MSDSRDDIKTAKLRYQVILIVLYLPLTLYVLWIAVRHLDLRFLLQRLGIGKWYRSDKPIWIHAASVGEVIATIPLVKALRQEFPNQQILMSTTTPTGFQTIKTRLSGLCGACYLPIDWTYAVNRFLSSTRPLAALIIETEIWPNLYNAINAQDIPLITVNGRISHRTLDAPHWILDLYRDCIKKIDTVLARSRLDGDRFISLGVSNERVKVVGNLKFSPSLCDIEKMKPILTQAYIVAFSTHHNEEEQFARMWQHPGYDNYLLVIVPRHPRRRKKITKIITKYTANVAIRSLGDAIQPDTRVYLADTFGELTNFLAFANLVIVGGSFVKHGGHNILEPAQLGKAIICGPSMENFSDECELLLQADGLIQCEDVSQLHTHLQQLLQDPHRAAVLGNNAKQTMSQFSAVVEQYIEIIQPYLVPAP